MRVCVSAVWAVQTQVKVEPRERCCLIEFRVDLDRIDNYNAEAMSVWIFLSVSQS